MPLVLRHTSGYAFNDQGLTSTRVEEHEMHITLEPCGDILWRGYSKRLNGEQCLRRDAEAAMSELSAHYDRPRM